MGGWELENDEAWSLLAEPVYFTGRLTSAARAVESNANSVWRTEGEAGSQKDSNLSLTETSISENRGLSPKSGHFYVSEIALGSISEKRFLNALPSRFRNRTRSEIVIDP